jgi:Cupin-like domain
MSQHTRAHIDQDVWAEWIAYNAATGALDGDILNELLAAGVDPERAAVWISEVRGHPIFKAAQAVQSDAQKLIDINDVLVQLEGIRSTRGALERVSNISAEGFLKQLYSTNTPVILTDIAADWPAIGKWNLEYLDKHFGQYEITYQYRELDGDHRNALFNNQRRSPLSEYITNIADNQNSRNYYLVAQDRLLKRMAFRPLLDDIILDHPIFDASSAKKHLSLWMGPKGSVTPMHRDRCNVFFCTDFGSEDREIDSPKVFG